MEIIDWVFLTPLNAINISFAGYSSCFLSSKFKSVNLISAKKIYAAKMATNALQTNILEMLGGRNNLQYWKSN